MVELHCTIFGFKTLKRKSDLSLFGGDYIFFCGQIHHKCYCMNSYTTLDNQVTATEAEG